MNFMNRNKRKKIKYEQKIGLHLIYIHISYTLKNKKLINEMINHEQLTGDKCALAPMASLFNQNNE